MVPEQTRILRRPGLNVQEKAAQEKSASHDVSYQAEGVLAARARNEYWAFLYLSPASDARVTQGVFLRPRTVLHDVSEPYRTLLRHEPRYPRPMAATRNAA